MNEFAVAALARKGAEPAGEIQTAEVRLRELRANSRSWTQRRIAENV
jgi:hypothetical protein